MGAGGQLGAAVVHECAGAHDTVALTRRQLDVSDAEGLTAAMDRLRPDVIVNGAAFTNVDAAEERPLEALDINAFAVRDLARAAGRHGATLVHYSTDFVFDGRASDPYTEEQPPNPQSTYAASKLLGEWFALDAPRAYVLRVESLFGRVPNGPAAKGSVAGILKTLEAGGAAKVFADRTISPTYIIDAARATRVRGRDVVILCPNVEHGEVPTGTTLFPAWDDARQWLEDKHGPIATASGTRIASKSFSCCRFAYASASCSRIATTITIVEITHSPRNVDSMCFLSSRPRTTMGIVPMITSHASRESVSSRKRRVTRPRKKPRMSRTRSRAK